MNWKDWKQPLLLGAGLMTFEGLQLWSTGHWYPVLAALALFSLVVGVHRLFYDPKALLGFAALRRIAR